MDPRLLALLIEDGRRRRDAAAGAAAQAERASRQANATLSTLQDYRRDYDRKAPKVRLTAIVPDLLARHEHFVERLDVAVDDQVQQAQRARELTEARRSTLREAERRVKAFEMLRARHEAEKARRTARREQFETDELATRLALNTRKHEDRQA